MERAATTRRRLGVVPVLIFLVLATLAPVSPAIAADFVAVVSGAWDDPTTWAGTVPPSPVGTGTSVTIPDGTTVDIPADLTVVIEGGSLHVDGRLHVVGTLETEGEGSRIVNGGTLLLVTGTLRVSGLLLDDPHLVNRGNVTNFAGHTLIGGHAVLVNEAGGELVNDGTLTASPTGTIDNRGVLENHGTLTLSAVASGAAGQPFGADLLNHGGEVRNRSTGTIDLAGVRAEIDNRNATLVNLAGGLIDTRGAVRNVATSGDEALLINHGHIWTRGVTTGEMGQLVNAGQGDALIENHGVIDADRFLTNNAPNGRIENHGEINVRNFTRNVRGLLANEPGGTIRVMDDGSVPGSLTNESLIENASEIFNDALIDNEEGEIRQLCGGTITGGGELAGNDPVDWCDTTAPEIHTPGPMTVEAEGPDGAVVTYNVTVTDNLDPDPSLECEPPSGHLFPLGTTGVTCIASDFVGNVAGVAFPVSVVDTTPPVINLVGEPEVEVIEGNPYDDAGATAFDVVDGDLTDQIITVDPVDTDVPGTYVVTYDVSDAAGNAADTVERTVTVVSREDAAAALAEMVEETDLPQGVAQPLIRTMDAAAGQLARDAGSETAAARLVDVFVDRVEAALADGDLSQEQADELLGQAAQLQASLS